MSIPYPRSGGVCSLDKFGVSLDQNQGQGPMIQPHVKNKYRVLFYNFGAMGETAEAISLNTNSVTIPTLTHQSHEVHSYNSIGYYAGKAVWGTSSLVVRDAADGTVMNHIGAQLQRQMDHYNQTTYLSAADYKFKMIIQILSGGHDVAMRNIHLCGCFLESAEQESLDYTTSDMVTWSMTVRPDNVIIEGQGAGSYGDTMRIPVEDPLSGLLAR